MFLQVPICVYMYQSELIMLSRAKRTGSVPRGNVQVYSYTQQPKRHTNSGDLPCASVWLGIKLVSSHPIATKQGDREDGLDRQNSNNNATALSTVGMIPGRAGQRLGPYGRRTRLDPLIERYSAFHH